MSPGLHRDVAAAAVKAGKSLNQWVMETLDQAVQHGF
jgi:predicted HicB family RNase H-like nuclease